MMDKTFHMHVLVYTIIYGRFPREQNIWWVDTKNLLANITFSNLVNLLLLIMSHMMHNLDSHFDSLECEAIYWWVNGDDMKNCTELSVIHMQWWTEMCSAFAKKVDYHMKFISSVAATITKLNVHSYACFNFRQFKLQSPNWQTTNTPFNYDI